MQVKYHPLTSANKDIFRGTVTKKEKEEHNSFIESLQKIEIVDVDVIQKIAEVLKHESIEEDLKKEIIKRLEAKYGNRK